MRWPGSWACAPRPKNEECILLQSDCFHILFPLKLSSTHYKVPSPYSGCHMTQSFEGWGYICWLLLRPARGPVSTGIQLKTIRALLEVYSPVRVRCSLSQSYQASSMKEYTLAWVMGRDVCNFESISKPKGSASSYDNAMITSAFRPRCPGPFPG